MPLGVAIQISPRVCACTLPSGTPTPFLNAIASGGTGPYTYLWTGTGVVGSTTQSVLPPCGSNGNYSVTVTDSLAATATDTVHWADPAVTAFSVFQLSAAHCGQPDGSIKITNVAGGLNYVWVEIYDSNSTLIQSFYRMQGGLDTTITGLLPDTYTVKVFATTGSFTTGTPITAGGTCQAIHTVTVNNTPSAVTASAFITNVSCPMGYDGSISLTPSGGTGPYTYLWSNGLNTATLDGLHAGTYSVIITDNIGCTASISYQITQPDAIQANIKITNPSDCNENLGSAVAFPTGGTAPYTYSWSTGDTTQAIYGQGAGDYSVTITDDNGCQETFEIELVHECCDLPKEDIEIAILNAKCCYGKLSIHYRNLVMLGEEDRDDCIIYKIMALYTILKVIRCIDDCEVLAQLLHQIKDICGCECCDDDITSVTFNPLNNQFIIV